MPIYPDLRNAHANMQMKSHLYRPTSFWAQASEQISEEIESGGVENFRRLPTPMGYFVPNYGSPTSGFTLAQVNRLKEVIADEFPEQKKSQLALKQYLDGYQSALADYRVMLAADNPEQIPYIHQFSESQFGNPVEQFDFNGKRYSRSSLNYMLGLSLLKKHLGDDEIRTVLEIGGGFGTLGEILAQSGIQSLRYIDIDIPPTQFVAERYLTAALGQENVSGFSDTEHYETIGIEHLKTASVLCSWQIEKLKLKVDLFVNFISFQEMEPEVVKNYLQHVKRLNTTWVLLRNMREGKQKLTATTAGVKTPIKSTDYIAMLDGYELVEANVHPFGFETVDGFHSELLLLKKK